MDDKHPYCDLWRSSEFFLALASSGVNLRSFDLIRENDQGRTTSDAFIFERITRPAIARYAKAVKRLVEDLVEKEALGKLEGLAKRLGERLKSDLHDDIRRYLDSCLVRDFTRSVDGEGLLLIAVLYFAYYKNKTATGAGIPPFFGALFFPLLVKAQKGGPDKVAEWQAALTNRFSAIWDPEGRPADCLVTFFEHPTTRTVVSFSFASIIEFMRKEREKVRYLFNVLHKLEDSDIQLFQVFLSNGLNAVLKKERRFPAPAPEQDASPCLRIGVVPHGEILAIVARTVDRHLDPAVDWAVQYQMSVSGNRPKAKLEKLFDKTFLTMNRGLWKELLALADIRKRAVFRTRHLLRLIIYYLFEIRELDRGLWQKYIPSVDRIIRFTYREDEGKRRQHAALLDQRLALYQEADEYRGTDWDGFCRDAETKALALKVIGDIMTQAASGRDAGIPAIWFSNLVKEGGDDQTLYKFFRQSRAGTDIHENR